jgi:hypothetical protein
MGNEAFAFPLVVNRLDVKLREENIVAAHRKRSL